MSRVTTLPRWIEPAIDLLFPHRCAVCLADVADGPGEPEPVCRDAGLCRGCVEEFGGGGRCERCGEIAADGAGCRGCRPVPWEWIGLIGGYDGAAREAVLRAKRPAGAVLCRALAAVWMARHGRTAAGRGFDRVVPVPMHWTRRILRGASAADELAGEIAGRMRRPVDRRLRRVRRTPMQKDLPPEERWANVRGAFRFRGRLDGSRVLLVDDVMTTGSTLSACCRAVAAAGAAGVGVAVMVKADRHAASEGRAVP